MAGLSRFDFYPRDWFLDTRNLSQGAKGLYVDLFVSMYARGGPLPYRIENGKPKLCDEQELCKLTGCSTVRSLKPLLKELITKGKLWVVDGCLINRRTMEEIAKATKKMAERSKGGKTRSGAIQAEYDGNTTGTQAERESGFVEKQGDNLKYPSPSPSPSQKEKKQYAFSGKIILLTEEDFTKWQETYHGIPDLNAELSGIDDWCDRKWPEGDSRRKDYWYPVKGMLNKKHQELLAKKQHDPDAEYFKELDDGVIH